MALPAGRPARPGRRRALFVLGAVLAGLGFLAGLWVGAAHLRDDPLADARAYYDAAARLNAGVPLYEQAVTTDEAEFYRYPPLLAIAFRPLALLPFEIAALVWEAVVVASFAVLCWRLGRRASTLIALGILALPIGWALAIGQAHVPLTLLMAVGAPWSIALATHLKVLPILIAVWWIGRRDWRALGQFGVWLLGLGLLQLVLEPTGTLAFPGVFGLEQVGGVRNWSPYAISPALWAGLVVVGVVATWRLAPTRYGWAAAVALSVLATPRLLTYQFMGLLAALREPAGTDEPGRDGAPRW